MPQRQNTPDHQPAVRPAGQPGSRRHPVAPTQVNAPTFGRSPTEPGEQMVDALVIECDSCVMRATSACTDCVVTYLCDAAEQHAVVFDLAEQRAVRWFAEAGLVPTLRHRAAETA
jgi:hypothetical protein